jgi:Fumarase C C-terminus
MADMCDHLRRYMIEGAERAEPKLTENIERSVMIVKALSPIIGYDNASVISHYAIDHNLTLKQAALDQGVSEELHDRWSTRSRRPRRLGGPGTGGEAGLSMTSDGAGFPDTTKHHDARPVGWMQSGRNRRQRKGHSAVAAKNDANQRAEPQSRAIRASGGRTFSGVGSE